LAAAARWAANEFLKLRPFGHALPFLEDQDLWVQERAGNTRQAAL
jgi:hypothetical protein